MFTSLTDILPHYAESSPERLFVRFFENSQVSGAYNYAEVWDWARRWASLFIDRGVRVGDAVILALPNRYSFVGAYFGALHAGAVPAAVPPIRELSADHPYLNTVLERARFIGARALVVEGGQEGLADLSPFSEEAGLSIFSERALPPAGEVNAYQARPNDFALLQFTSGTSGNAKAVQLTHKALLAQTAGIANNLRLDREVDWAVSWLPLFHDMGLIGFLLTPALVGGHVTFLLVEAFIRRPRIWLRALSELGATITGGPPSAYGLAARHLSAEQAAGYDLRPLRIALVGAEMISPGPLNDFAKALIPAGFRSTSYIPTYGLAENSLAVTMTPLDTGPTYDDVDLQTLQEVGLAKPKKAAAEEPIRSYASVGHPLQETEVAIAGAAGERLPERHVGEILVRSPSLLTGYFGNEEATREALPDGWLKTGDLGYQAGGNLYITGRKKEVMIVGGRNYYPDDLEKIVAGVPGVFRGRAVAFAYESERRATDVIVVMAEARKGAEDHLPLQIKKAALAAGYPVGEVILVAPKTIQVTANGKLKRVELKGRYLAGEFSHGDKIS